MKKTVTLSCPECQTPVEVSLSKGVTFNHRRPDSTDERCKGSRKKHPGWKEQSGKTKASKKKRPAATGRGSSAPDVSRLKPDVPPRTRTCRACNKRVPVRLSKSDEWLVQEHINHRDERCHQGGKVYFKEKKDAMDYRVPGSFEGGKRR